jgi:lipoic acid synthetase
MPQRSDTQRNDRRSFPPWLRKRVPGRGEAAAVRALLAELDLETVCASAHCPNLPECFARGTATFMILGGACTRSCRFCAVPTGPSGPPRDEEPEAVAEAADRMRLRHVVVTSVTRDDLPDGGAGHFARTIRALRGRLPDAVVEVLVPDFRGDEDAVRAVCDAGPDVFNHNIETVPRLYPAVRPEADYRQSLAVLAMAATMVRGESEPVPSEAEGHPPRDRRGSRAVAKEDDSRAAALPGHRADAGRPRRTKSGLMVGLGETAEEVSAVLADLRAAGCDMLTIGQYLAPSKQHVPVARFVEPAQFDAWEAEARGLGFAAVAAGPFVRSSYRAEEVFAQGATTG